MSRRRSLRPELVFIKISPGPILSNLRAVVSKWQLSQNVDRLRAKFCVERICVASLGYRLNRELRRRTTC